MSEAIVYVTCQDQAEAERVGQALIEAKLAACVNIVERITSMFWWKGKVEKEQEAVLIAKTESGLINQVTERVKSVHSYECPCVISLPIVGGNPEFLQWIREETKEAGGE